MNSFVFNNLNKKTIVIFPNHHGDTRQTRASKKDTSLEGMCLLTIIYIAGNDQ